MKDEYNTNMNIGSDYRMRLRFLLSKPFDSDKLEESIVIDGRIVTIKSRTKEQPLNEAKWLIAGANGFLNEADARMFGVKLRHAIQFASLEGRNGIDCGNDEATSAWGASFRQEIFEQTGKNLRNDLHGIDVFKNDDSAMFMTFSANLEVRAGMEPFLKSLVCVFPWIDKVNPKVERIVILLNNVLMNPEPVAQIILAISTIEGLGQDQELSAGQKQLLKQLASLSMASSDITQAEADEVQDAILKIHKLSLRQGVLRLLKNAGLDLRREWDAIYSERSTLVHGLAPKPGIDYRPLADRTVKLCFRILHRLIEIEIGSTELANISLANYQ
jgi:hypothetical protein